MTTNRPEVVDLISHIDPRSIEGKEFHDVTTGAPFTEADVAVMSTATSDEMREGMATVHTRWVATQYRVELLTRTAGNPWMGDDGKPVHPSKWTYRDTGELLTPEDVEQIMQVTADDWTASAELMHEKVIEADVSYSITHQWSTLMKRYFDLYFPGDDTATVEQILPFMSTEDRELFMELSRAVYVEQNV